MRFGTRSANVPSLSVSTKAMSVPMGKCTGIALMTPTVIKIGILASLKRPSFTSHRQANWLCYLTPTDLAGNLREKYTAVTRTVTFGIIGSESYHCFMV